MIVKLFDGTEFKVPNKRGEEIAKGISGSKDSLVSLGGGYVKASAIATILPGGYTEADLPPKNPPDKRLVADTRSLDEQHKAARVKAESIRQILKTKGFAGFRNKVVG